MFLEATVLILFYLRGANCQGEAACGSSLEMRRVAMNKELAAISCENYVCGKHCRSEASGHLNMV